MWLRSIAYRLGQVRQQLGFVAPLTGEDYEEAARVLPSSAALSLFCTMSPADQQHALRVCRGLQAHGCTNEDMLAAALLHDVGKAQGRVPFWTRPAIVLGKKLAPQLLSRLVLYPENWLPIPLGPDYANEQINGIIRRGRFIAPIADLSAPGEIYPIYPIPSSIC